MTTLKNHCRLLVLSLVALFLLAFPLSAHAQQENVTCVANKQDFYHLFSTPQKRFFSFQIANIIWYIVIFVPVTTTRAEAVSSRLFSSFLIFSPAKLVNRW